MKEREILKELPEIKITKDNVVEAIEEMVVEAEMDHRYGNKVLFVNNKVIKLIKEQTQDLDVKYNFYKEEFIKYGSDILIQELDTDEMSLFSEECDNLIEGCLIEKLPSYCLKRKVV